MVSNDETTEEEVYRIDLNLKVIAIGVFMLVTTGHTIVPWDGVRHTGSAPLGEVDDHTDNLVPKSEVPFVGNSSAGGYGVEIANAAADRGVPVILLCNEFTSLKYRPNDKVTVIHYKTFKEYEAALESIAKMYKIGYAISAAAVSDFGFERVVGKINSKELVAPKPYRLPKLLQRFRELFGPTCYRVGFKLNDHPRNILDREPTAKEWKAAVDKLIAEADAQIKACHLNLTVANFAPWGNNPDAMRKMRRLWLRRPDGGSMELYGSGRQTAMKLVDYILEQADVTWGRSVPYTDEIAHPDRPDSYRESYGFAQALLRFAQGSNLLHSRAGNVTVMTEADFAQAWVTPRGADKTSITAEDMCLASMHNGQDAVIDYASPKPGVKPSIDSRVYLMTSRMFPFEATLHFHDGWVLDSDAATKRDFACGTNKAAGELIAAITRSGAGGHNEPFMIELVRHGHTLFLNTQDDLDDIESRWTFVQRAYREHLEDVRMLDRLDEFQLAPIWDKARIVGVVARHKTEGWHSFFLHPDSRGSGMGSKLVNLIDERQVNVGVHRDCKVKDFYIDRAFEVLEERESEELTIFGPPCLRDDLRKAATIRVVCPTRRSILLGKRSSLYSYPTLRCNLGGGIEKDVTTMVGNDPHTMLDLDSWSEAVREFKEESGVDLSHLPRPDTYSVHYTRTVRKDGSEVVWRVTCYELEVGWQFHAEPQTDELESIGWEAIPNVKFLERGQATKETHRDLEHRYPPR